MVVEIEIGSFAVFTIPAKDQTPLPVHPKGMSARKRAFQHLEMIAGRTPQIQIAGRVVQQLQFAKELRFQIGGDGSAGKIQDEKLAQPPVTKVENHPSSSPDLLYRSMGQSEGKFSSANEVLPDDLGLEFEFV